MSLFETSRSAIRHVALQQPEGRSRSAAAADDAAGDRAIFRVLDVTIASVALVFLSPLLLFIALAIRLQDGGPAIFMHERVGRGGRMFGCLKFRSMVVDSDERLAKLLQSNAYARAEWEADHKLRNDPRITWLGRLLRSSSLDELPQLFNVLRGEMSLVGPRPVVAAEIRRYGRRAASYYKVRPGLTGLWQISGRNDVRYSRRVAYDVIYVRRASPALYIWILVATAPAVLLRRGSY